MQLLIELTFKNYFLYILFYLFATIKLNSCHLLISNQETYVLTSSNNTTFTWVSYQRGEVNYCNSQLSGEGVYMTVLYSAVVTPREKQSRCQNTEETEDNSSRFYVVLTTDTLAARKANKSLLERKYGLQASLKLRRGNVTRIDQHGNSIKSRKENNFN